CARLFSACVTFGETNLVDNRRFSEKTLNVSLTNSVGARKLMPKQVLAPASSAPAGAAPTLAVEINVLSGAAVEPGLIAAADIFCQRTGNTVKITFATTPEIRRLFGTGITPDVVIAPHAALDELARS